MALGTQLKFVAIFGLATQILIPAADPSSAQTVFTQRQIIHQLRLPAHAIPQDVVVNPGRKFRRRAPHPQNGDLVYVDPGRRQRGPVAYSRPPQPHGGDVAFRRVPPPHDGEVVFSRPPQPQGGRTTAEMRVPPSSRTVKSRAPHSAKPEKVASAESPKQVRGLDVRPVSPTSTESTTEYRDSGRIDLEILFDYDSDRIKPASVRQLIELGEALNDPELDKGKFMIAGHTDAVGSNAYNSDLSLRRAQAVSRFLTEFAGVDAGRLTMEGFGEEYLKYPDAPESGQNRRVEIINLGESG
jgi:outer membrane protein OmpA-like peptidoglycan-associated protein